MSCQLPKHLFSIPLISIMSISYETIGNNFKWPFVAAKWSEFSHFFWDFKYLYHLESLSGHNWTEFLVDFEMGESLGLGKKSSGPETDTETSSWFRLPIPKLHLGFGCRNQVLVVHYCPLWNYIMKYFQNLALAENLENMDLRHTRRSKLFSWQCPTNVVRNHEDFDPLIIHN